MTPLRPSRRSAAAPLAEHAEPAKRGERKLHPFLAVLLSFVFILVGIVFAETMPGVLSPLLDSLRNELTKVPAVSSAIRKIVELWLLNVPILLILWGWLSRIERRPFHSLGFGRSKLLLRYGEGGALGFAMLSAAAGLLALAGAAWFEPASGQTEGLAAIGGVLLVCTGWALQAAAEETLFRGWLLQTIQARSGARIGIAVSSLCFAAVHSLNNGFSLLVFINLTLFGIFLALYRLAEGSLWGVCAWHAAWNWTLGNFYGADVSGGAPEGGSLLHLALDGPDWLTGGAFGLEGGIGTTAVFAIGIAALLVIRRRRAK